MLQKFLTRITIVIITLAIGFASFPNMSQAGQEEAAEAAHRVNIAGRQRMLSQRMTKAACFIYNGINTDQHVAMLSTALALFTSSHNALRYGDEAIGLGPENLKQVNEALYDVDQNWSDFKPLVEAILDGTQPDANTLRLLDEKGLSLLANMNRVVGRIASGYGELLPEFPLDQSITIDIAGRQRMLSQKATKEMCLIMAGINVAENRDRLAKTTKLFTDVGEALINGIPGMVAAAPNDTIRAQLTKVQTKWELPRGIFADVAAGGNICCGNDQIVIEKMEIILKAMNQAVGMYETAW